jgi:hypothetical protein
MVAKSSARIGTTGLSPPVGFHEASGTIGRKARLATSSAMWMTTCWRGAMRSASQWA